MLKCLKDLDISESDKIDISSRYDEETIKNAVEWVTNPKTEIRTTLIQTLRWACREKPQRQNSDYELKRENRDKALHLLRQYQITPTVEVEMLNKHVEFVFKGGQRPSICIEYNDPKFTMKMEENLSKYSVSSDKSKLT